jgi:phosphatidylinositol alpha-mannosyltransferase
MELVTQVMPLQGRQDTAPTSSRPRLRIAIVTQSYYPRYGGVTENVHHTAVELRRRGHDVTIVTARFHGDEAVPREGVERIGRNILIPSNGAFVDFTLGVTLRQRLRRLLERKSFDLVHVHCPVMPTLPVLAIQEARCARVGTFHTSGAIHAIHDVFARYLRKTVVDRLDLRIAVSVTAAESAAHYYPGDYCILPNGVDIERFSPAVAPLEDWHQPGVTTLLFVSRLDRRKGLPVLLAAMPALLASTTSRIRLLVIGDSALRPTYEKSVPAAVRPYIHFLGHVPSDELPRWYRTADLFVAPAIGQESFGIVLLEAMASGCAVIASDLPGFRSVLRPEKDSLVFAPGSVPELAERLLELVDDVDRRRQLAAAGRARAAEFAWPRITERLEGMYYEACGRSAGSASRRSS